MMRKFWRRHGDNVKYIAIWAAILAILSGLFWLDHKAWRAEHPHAKGWTYFTNHRRG